MANEATKPGKRKKTKVYRTANQKAAIGLVRAFREGSIVIRDHVVAGFDIPADCRTAMYKAAMAFNEAVSLLGNVKVVKSNSEVTV